MYRFEKIEYHPCSTPDTCDRCQCYEEEISKRKTLLSALTSELQDEIASLSQILDAREAEESRRQNVWKEAHQTYLDRMKLLKMQLQAMKEFGERIL